ncbi:hypothetical protein ULMA_10310 [Patiriisocius marinus]|uniref:Uncharacterized protein n=1 Tax=Patiriisocius marinus TaxID=1397112 RepID=A0A5J4IZK1_9FLAO|nr:hypothetical protein [Patiriisocius marinus]GER58923.1 hypothetical protein ULMA_10310 [Patiriisocius marinus]
MNRITIATLASILLLFILGCNDTSTSTKEIFNGFALQPVNFLNKKVYIPSNYTKTNLDELGEMLTQNPDLNKLDKMNYKFATSSYDQSGNVPVLYQDSIVNTNSIWFLPGAYTPINKGLVNEFVNATERQFLKPAEQQGVSFDRLEAKFITQHSLKAIKVKYQLKTENSTRYFTQFIITKNLETYSMVVLHDYNEDFQKILKSL